MIVIGIPTAAPMLTPPAILHMISARTPNQMLRQILRKPLLLSALFVSSASLMGCNLYFEEDDGARSTRGGDCRGEDCWIDVTPSSCEENVECGPGCFCTEQGTCEETDFCDETADCAEGFECDDRDTCVPSDVPDPDPVVTCQSEVSCDLEAPICPVGTTAGILDGCYTGECLAKEDCPDGAPFECSDLNTDELACTDSDACSAVYKGVNCTSNTGADCTSGSADCTCESFEYDYCE